VKLLLDTRALILIVSGRRLARRAAAAYEDLSNSVFVSVASYWEIAIKSSLRKLELSLDNLDEELSLNRMEWLPIERVHCRRLAGLASHHRDPFDRLLAAQALCEDLAVISNDSAFDAYGVKRVW
jgi:PIN domain nuclease of toxin-antitoxin system